MATTTIPLQPVGSLITLGMPINVTRAKQALKVFVTQETQTVFNLPCVCDTRDPNCF